MSDKTHKVIVPGPMYVYVNVQKDTRGNARGFEKAGGRYFLDLPSAEKERRSGELTFKCVLMNAMDYESLANASRVLHSM